MGIFSRMATLLKSNLNDLISGAEDPAKMLEQIILEMNQQLIEAKKQVAIAIADEKKLQKQFDREAKTAQEWEKKAMLAIHAGDDELAKEALLRKGEHDGLVGDYKEQWEKQHAAVTHLKTALRALNHKIEEAKRKKNVLIARQRRAEAMKNIQETMSGLKDGSAFEAFDRMSQKIDQTEAEAEASAELSEEYTGDILKYKFDKLQTTAGADQELLALKRKMGMVAEEEPAVATRVAEESSSEDDELAELEEALAELKKRELG